MGDIMKLKNKLIYFVIVLSILSIIIIPSSTLGKYLSSKNKSINISVRKPEYTVVFHSNDGTNTTNSQNFVYGTAQNLNSNTYSRVGYTYGGWTTNSNGTGTSYTNGQQVNNLTSVDGANYDLYAKWIPNTYTITFDYNGGVDQENIIAKYDMKSSSNTSTTLADLSGNGHNGTHVNTTIGKDYVTYNGTNSNPSWTKLGYMHSDYMVMDVTFSLSNNTVRQTILSNCRSGGLAIRIDGSGQIAAQVYRTDGVDKYPTSHVVPVIGQIYHVILAIDNEKAKLYINGERVDSSSMEGNKIKAPGNGGSPSAPTIMALGASPKGNTQVSSDRHFYGNIYSASIYSYVHHSKTVTYDSTYGTLPEPYRQGYNFDGWYIDDDTRVYDISTVKITSDTKLVAHWSPVKYYIRYRRNGPDCAEMAYTEAYYDQEVNLSLNEYVFPNSNTGGYNTFLGWNSNSSGTGIPYSDGETVFNLGDTEGQVVQIFAQWD